MIGDEKLKRKRSPEKTRHNCARMLLIPLALFALCTVFSVIGVNWFMGEMRAVGDPANEFMLALRDGDMDTALAWTTPDTRMEWEASAYLLEFVPRPEDWTFNSFSIRNNRGRVAGSVTLANGTETSVQLYLRPDDGWRITGVFYGE